MRSLQLDEAVERLLRDLSAPRSGQILSLSGVPAAGRREALSRLRSGLVQDGRTVILLDLPTSELDNGALSVIQAGRDVCSGELGEARDDTVSFDRKMDLILGNLGEQGVGLVYAPWLRPSDETDEVSLRSGRGVLEVVARFCQRMPVVVALARPLPLSRVVSLAKFAAGADWVNSEFPPELAPFALSMVQEASGCSRLEIRLAAGLLALNVPREEVRRLTSGQFPLTDLVEAFWRAIQARRPDLTRAWQVLATARRPLPEAAAIDALSARIFDDILIRHCLTFRREGRVVLHERLRNHALMSMADAGERGLTLWKDTNFQLARLWTTVRERALNRQAGWEAIEADLDMVYHHVEAGEPWAEVRDRIHFQDQLCLVGRTLSKRYKRYSEAADCFQRARELDPEDAYGWHYEAYNKARLHPPPTPTVTEGYARAVDLEPTNVWYHQRLVRWLLFRGRSRDARHAWASALDQTQEQSAWGEANLWYYKNLHWLVACRAMDTGELQLARAILNQVPRSLLDEDPDLRRADRLLDAFERSEKGVLTYPLDEEVREGLPRLWSQPRRLPDRSDVDGQERVSWYAARVEALEADRLHLLVGVPTPEASAPMECSWAEMPRNVFGQAVVDEEPGRVTVGRFFEAGEYGADRRLVIRLFPLLEAAVPETILR